MGDRSVIKPYLMVVRGGGVSQFKSSFSDMLRFTYSVGHRNFLISNMFVFFHFVMLQCSYFVEHCIGISPISEILCHIQLINVEQVLQLPRTPIKKPCHQIVHRAFT